jgi:hypothetical protein
VREQDLWRQTISRIIAIAFMRVVRHAACRSCLIHPCAGLVDGIGHAPMEGRARILVGGRGFMEKRFAASWVSMNAYYPNALVIAE